MVDADDLVTANALDSVTWSTMLAIGAMLGGVATALFGVTAAFLIDAASFLLSAWFVSRVHLAEGAASAHTVSPGVRAGMFAFVEGLRYLAGQPAILVVALAKAGGALVWGAVNVLEIPLAEKVFPINGSGSLTLGLIYMAVGIGTAVSPLALRSWLGDSRPAMVRAISIGFLCMTIGVFGLALAPSLAWLLAATTVRGLGTGALWVFSTVLLQQLVPDRVRGRVFAFEFAALTLTQSISIISVGYAYDTMALNLQQILLAVGTVSIVVTLAWGAFHLFMRSRALVASN